jgi:hypothetical protein
MRAASVRVEFASRQVSKFGLIEGRFRCDPTGAMNGHDVVTIDPWQEIRSLDPSRNLMREKKFDERLGRGKIRQSSK